jgi:hypothetical protein
MSERDMPNRRKLIGNYWIFVQKWDGSVTTRNLALGYSQVAGIGFLTAVSLYCVIHASG